MDGLLNTVSNAGSAGSPLYADYSGNNIMPHGNSAKLAVGTYKCNESGSNCAHAGFMLYTEELPGSIVCTDDSADCVLNGGKRGQGC